MNGLKNELLRGTKVIKKIFRAFFRCFFGHAWAEMCSHENKENALGKQHGVAIYYMCIDCYKTKNIYHIHENLPIEDEGERVA